MARERRTDKDLGKTLHGRIFAVARKAFNIGNRQAPVRKVDTGRKSKRTGKPLMRSIGTFKGVTALEGVEYPSGAFYRVTKAGAPYWNLKEDDPKFAKLRAAAKAAYDDVKALRWTGSVQTLLQEMMTVEGPPGERGIGTEDIQGFTF